MSWKSFITASLLCILASPAFGASAVPQLEIINDGVDPATGNWVWYVRVAPSDGARTNSSGPSTGSPMAVELGFKTNSASPMVGVNNVGYSGTTGNLWDTDTPGKAIFGWEDNYQIIDPNTLLPTGTLAPEGIEVFCGANCTPGSPLTLTNGATRPTGTGNNHPTTYDSTGTAPANGERTEAFVALGSNVLTSANTGTPAYLLHNPNLLAAPSNFGADSAPISGNSNFSLIGPSNNLLKITTKGPTAILATSTVSATMDLMGSHGAGNNEGRIAEITTGTNGTNYKLGTSGNSASVSIKPGDINLDGAVNGLDVGIISPLIGTSSAAYNWTKGDFNGDGNINGLDVGIIAPNIGTAGGAYTAVRKDGVNDPPTAPELGSAGLGEGTGVPEPASLALVGLAILGGLGLVGRKR